MAQTFDSNRRQVAEFKNKEYDSILAGKTKGKSALNRLGVFYKGLVQETFRSGDFEPNSQATVMRKTKGAGGKTTPLIDTGRLRNSINFEVVDE